MRGSFRLLLAGLDQLDRLSIPRLSLKELPREFLLAFGVMESCIDGESNVKFTEVLAFGVGFPRELFLLAPYESFTHGESNVKFTDVLALGCGLYLLRVESVGSTGLPANSCTRLDLYGAITGVLVVAELLFAVSAAEIFFFNLLRLLGVFAGEGL